MVNYIKIQFGDSIRHNYEGGSENINYKRMTNEFADKKARKWILYNYLILFIAVYVKYKKTYYINFKSKL